MAEDEKQDLLYTVVLSLLLVIVGINLILDYGRGVDAQYINFFIVLIGFGLLGGLVLAAYSKWLGEDGYEPNIIDSSSVRGLADKPWSRTIAALVLFVIFLGGGLFTQSSIIPIVNPYDASTLIAKGSELSTEHSKYATALRSGVYPGFGEDVAGFLFTSVTTFGLLLLFRRFDEDALNDGWLFGIAVFLSCILWGFVFASAHALAYGSNMPAFIFAWLYGSVTQLVNQLVGAPVSILAHIGHNFIIVASLSIATCVGTLCLGVLCIPRGLLMKPLNKKGSAWLIGIVAAAIIGFILIVLSTTGVIGGEQQQSMRQDHNNSWTINCWTLAERQYYCTSETIDYATAQSRFATETAGKGRPYASFSSGTDRPSIILCNGYQGVPAETAEGCASGLVAPTCKYTGAPRNGALTVLTVSCSSVGGSS